MNAVFSYSEQTDVCFPISNFLTILNIYQRVFISMSCRKDEHSSSQISFIPDPASLQGESMLC